MGMYAIGIEAYPSHPRGPRIHWCGTCWAIYTSMLPPRRSGPLPRLGFSPHIFSYGLMFPRTFCAARAFLTTRRNGSILPQSLQQVGLMQHGTHAFEEPAVEQHDHASMTAQYPALEEIR
jgi:hypothetical protein